MNIINVLADDAEDIDDIIAVDDDVSTDPIPMSDALNAFTNVVSGSNEYNTPTTRQILNIVTRVQLSSS